MPEPPISRLLLTVSAEHTTYILQVHTLTLSYVFEPILHSLIGSETPHFLGLSLWHSET